MKFQVEKKWKKIAQIYQMSGVNRNLHKDRNLQSLAIISRFVSPEKFLLSIDIQNELSLVYSPP